MEKIIEKIINSKTKGKQAWLRIVEAFIAVLLVMTVMLVVMSRNQPSISSADEIGKLQTYTLDYVANDELLRGQVLSGNLSGADEKVKSVIPQNYNYSLRICNYSEVCALGFNVPGEIYSKETVLFANLTYYNPGNVTKLKMFWWKN